MTFVDCCLGILSPVVQADIALTINIQYIFTIKNMLLGQCGN